MDNALIKNWNSVVKDNDIIFNLGDFAFAPNWRWEELINILKGKHLLIVGNHDTSRYPGDHIMSLFERVENQMMLDIDGRKVYLNHYPFLCYADTYRDNEDKRTIQLYGHVHSGPYKKGYDINRLQCCFAEQYDVGVDNNNYYPINYNDVLIKIKERRYAYEHI